MRIGGLIPFSLSDFPGTVSAVIFTQGCNFRCPYCHNSTLIPLDPTSNRLIPERELFRFLKGRLGQLDGVAISGGEPTIQPDLAPFLGRLKSMGYKVKLDTNGSRPEMLRTLLNENLLDFIAMDIKAPPAIYNLLTGVQTPLEKLSESISVISQSGVRHEFRTTVVEPLLSENAISELRELLPPNSTHRLNEFRSENAFDPGLRMTDRKRPKTISDPKLNGYMPLITQRSEL